MSDPTVPSSSSPEPAPGSASPATSAPAAPGVGGLAPNIAAMLACIFPVVGGIVFLVLEKTNQFVRFYAMQSLVFAVAGIAFSIALQIVVRILVHIPLIGWLIAVLLGILGAVVGLGMLAVWVVTIIKAYSNKEWEIPYLGKIAREQLAKMTPTT